MKSSRSSLLPMVMAAAMLGGPLTELERKPKVVTQHDLERIEKARLKRERKRKKREHAN